MRKIFFVIALFLLCITSIPYEWYEYAHSMAILFFMLVVGYIVVDNFYKIFWRATCFPPILVILLLLGLAPMPYWYYELTGYYAMWSCGVMAFAYYKEGAEVLAATFSTLAFLYQPFEKVELGHTIWNIVDAVVAIGVVALWLKEGKKWKLLLKDW